MTQKSINFGASFDVEKELANRIFNMSDLQITLYQQTPQYLIDLLRYTKLDEYIKDTLDFRTFSNIQDECKLANWSMREITPEQLTEPHAYQGIKYLAYDDVDYETDTVVLSLVNGDTWFDLWKSASLIIHHELGDHSFIEGFSLDSTNPKCLWLHTGS